MKNRMFLAVAGAAIALAVTVGVFAANEATVSSSLSYNKEGIAVSVSKSRTFSVAGTNVNAISFNTGTADTAITPAPLISNTWWAVLNTSPTGTVNYIACGNSNDAVSRVVFVEPGDPPMIFKLRPGGDGALHCACSNGTQSGIAFPMTKP